jgi:hypothetical protein
MSPLTHGLIMREIKEKKRKEKKRKEQKMHDDFHGFDKPFWVGKEQWWNAWPFGGKLFLEPFSLRH